MRRIRRHSRVDVGGMTVEIEGSLRPHRVLNLSEHGMLVDGLDLEVGEAVSFVLAGNGGELSGRGRLAHRSGGVAGISVQAWDSSPGDVTALMVSQLFADMTLRETYVADWS